MLTAMGRKSANTERHNALWDSSGYVWGVALGFVAILVIRAAWARHRKRMSSASHHAAHRPRVVGLEATQQSSDPCHIGSRESQRETQAGAPQSKALGRSDTKTLQANFPDKTREEVVQALSKSEGHIGKAIVQLSTTDDAGPTKDKKVLEKTNTKILQASFPDKSRTQILETLEANEGSLARSLVGMAASEESYPSQPESAGAAQPKFFGRSDTKHLQASFPDKQRADIVQALSKSDGHIGKAIVQLSTGDTVAGEGASASSASAPSQDGGDSRPILRKTDTQTLQASFPGKPRTEILEALAKNDGRLGSAVVDLSSS